MLEDGKPTSNQTKIRDVYGFKVIGFEYGNERERNNVISRIKARIILW
jgi:hypothetical protein